MKLRFKSKQKESGDVWSFIFEPAEPLDWTAGQSIRLEIPRKTWGYDERRFTIASAPFEKQLRITTRLSGSDFKNLLDALEAGDAIDGYGVEGRFVWGNQKRHRLLIAAGIGITPYRSMLAQRLHDNRPVDATLIYVTRDNPPVFGEELEEWSRKGKFNLHFAARRLDLGEDATLAPLWMSSLIYLSGPEKMVREMSARLVELGVLKDRIRLDEFTGIL